MPTNQTFDATKISTVARNLVPAEGETPERPARMDLTFSDEAGNVLTVRVPREAYDAENARHVEALLDSRLKAVRDRYDAFAANMGDVLSTMKEGVSTFTKDVRTGVGFKNERKIEKKE